MINKTKWLSVVAGVAVLGSAATPIMASAHGTDGSGQASASVSDAGKTKHVRASSALAAQLGIDQAVLEAAVKAAAEATPKPDDKTDPAAREAYQAAFNTTLAANLGITLDALSAAQAQVKADAEAKKAERGDGAEEKSEHFAQLLARLVTAGILTQAQADEIMVQYNLGGEAQAQVVKRVRALLHDQKAEQQFTQMLTRLVTAGVLTQAQADEVLAQYQLGGEAKGQVIKRLRALLQEEKTQRRDEKREQKRDEKHEQKREQKKPGIERTLKARPGQPA